MDIHPSLQDIFTLIFTEPRFLKVTNQLCVYKYCNQFIIEDYTKSEDYWQLIYDYDIVRAIALLRKHNLTHSTNYKIAIGKDCMVLKTHGHAWTHFMASHHKCIRNVIHKIQLLLFCKVNIYEFKEEDEYKTRIWIYPKKRINGFFLFLPQQATKILKEVVCFANSASIEIIKTQEESQFNQNPEVKEKLLWESFLFNYQHGVCFILFENYSNLRKQNYITKVPEFPPHVQEKLKDGDNFYSSDRYYIQCDGINEWQTSIKTYLEEEKEKNNFYYKMNKDKIDKSIAEFEESKNRKSTSSEWESIDDNPYYRWDIEDDKQDIEFWNSI